MEPMRGTKGKGVVVLLVAVLLVCVAGGVKWGFHRAMARRGTVRIATNPAGAEIVFDGMRMDMGVPDDDADPWSPALVLHRLPGTYDLSVTATGLQTRSARVVVQAGQTTSLDIDLGSGGGDSNDRATIVATPALEAGHADGHLLMHAGEAHGRSSTVGEPIGPRPVRTPPASRIGRPVNAPTRSVPPIRPVFYRGAPIRPVVPIRPIIIP